MPDPTEPNPWLTEIAQPPGSYSLAFSYCIATIALKSGKSYGVSEGSRAWPQDAAIAFLPPAN
jgi:hypothetical protein